VIRRLLLVAAVLLGFLAFSEPAQAGDLYDKDCGFVLDPPVVPIEGGEIHIVGGQFLPPGAEFDFFIEGEFLGTAQSDPEDADGNIDVTFPLPEAFAIDGTFTITVECPSGSVASNVLIVGLGGVTTTTSPPTTAALPVTGSNSTGNLVVLGLGLVGVGALVLFLSRRRAGGHATVGV
jgi:LPXTG-motif cell wall-anchored protein